MIIFYVTTGTLSEPICHFNSWRHPVWPVSVRCSDKKNKTKKNTWAKTEWLTPTLHLSPSEEKKKPPKVGHAQWAAITSSGCAECKWLRPYHSWLATFLQQEDKRGQMKQITPHVSLCLCVCVRVWDYVSDEWGFKDLHPPDKQRKPPPGQHNNATIPTKINIMSIDVRCSSPSAIFSTSCSRSQSLLSR